jgi:hypothetical protein
MDDKELAPLPLSRMRTVSKPSFWAYLVACMILYTYLLINYPYSVPRLRYSVMVAFCVFFALFLELISQWTKNKRIAHNLSIMCYVFEIASTMVFLFIIFYS